MTNDDNILKELLQIIPCSFVPNHTKANLPSMVKELVKQSEHR